MKVGVNVIIPENTWGHSLADRPKGYKYPVYGSSREADLTTQTGSAIQHLNYMLLRQVWRLCAVALTVPGIWIPSMAILNILHSCQSRHQIW